ncbi:MAG: hypothetical protein BMS9Abin39_0608 [Ignavibacteria bacterium]|nr:MAG: hypothetical protein BMS9Abin39_0608 [Ignavibacteria bacterium]
MSNLNKYDMFEKEIKFISDFSLNKVKKLGSFVTFEKLSGTDLHPAIISYISAEFDYMIYRDRKKLLADSIFDYSGRKIIDHFKIIAEEIKQSKKISFEDVKKLIIQAVSFNINYVVRPKWSLTKLIYNDQDSVSVDELDRMLNYLYYYDYIKNVISAYISRRKVIQLTLTEFELILNKIDRELFKSNAEELINNAILSIADFFNIGGIKNNQVSLSGVEVLLKEKNMIDYLLKLRHAMPDDSRKKYEIEEIKSVLYSVIPDKTELTPEIESETIESIDDQISAGTESSTLEADTETVAENNFQQDEVTDVKDKSAGEDENDLLPIEEEFQEERTQKNIEKSELEIDEEINKNNDQPRPDDESESSLNNDGLISKEFNLNETIPELKPIDSEEYTTNDDDIELEATFDDEEQMIKEIDVNELIPELEATNTEENIGDENGDLNSDELLAFYEKELESMEETLAQQDDDELQSPDKSNTELVETQQKETTENEQGDTEKVEEQEINYSSEETGSDDFDLSVFDDLPDGEGDNESSNTIKNSVDKVSSSDENIAGTENAGVQNTDIKLTVEKEIVNEMINDLKGDINVDRELLDRASGVPDKSEKDLTTGSGSASTAQKSEQQNTDTALKEQQTKDELDPASKLSEESPLEEDASNFTEEIDIVDEQNSSEVEIEESGVRDKGSTEKFIVEKSDANDIIFIYDKISEEGKIDREKLKNETSSGETSISANKVEEQVRELDVPIKENDLLSYLTKKEVKKIISNIFDGDEEDFVTTIEKVTACSSYKEATEIIKGVYFVYRISPYAKEAVIFTNSVSNYFRQV